jgi:hypothetical protein
MSNGMIAASKKQAAIAEKEIKRQTKRAEKADKEVAAVKNEMRGRNDGAALLLGEYHQSWKDFEKATLEWQGKLNRHERLVEEAKVLTNAAKEAEGRAVQELTELKLKIEIGPVAADLVGLSKALAAAELKAEAEMALRLKAQAKLAQVRIFRDNDVKNIAQLNDALKISNQRGDKIAEIFRSGPFRFGEWQ